ncbi:MAG: FAD-dependent oxidoreductase, partial [Flavobacteriaceae bacterium]
DGNHGMPSGIWGEFRQRLYNHYGGPEAVATGWVSHTLFEPSVGDSILKAMAQHPNLIIEYNVPIPKVERVAAHWEIQYQKEGKTISLKANILVDATETGAILPLVKAPFRLGMDARRDTGEKEAPPSANSVVQDITYVAILKDVGQAKHTKGLVQKPTAYSPEDYSCACKRKGHSLFGAVNDCQQMLNYAKLPNNKYIINWPHCGNDFFLDWPNLTPGQITMKLQAARTFTQGFVYYIQQELGYQNLRLAQEFPQGRSWPMIPYHRESRRLQGAVLLITDHLKRPYDFTLYRTGIAVGDYPIDHHHDKNPDAPKIDFINIKIPSYTIPLGCLMTESIPNFLVAEKNISVSNIVNGTTRLQPVVLGIGQAAGTLATLAIQKGKSPQEISIRSVQRALIQSGAYVMPFVDVLPGDPDFGAMQRIGATGILKGYGVPYKWANQTWFYPERTISEHELKQGLLPYYPELDAFAASGEMLTSRFLHELLLHIAPQLKVDLQGFLSEKKDTPLTRRNVCKVLDRHLDPFSLEVAIDGTLPSRE